METVCIDPRAGRALRLGHPWVFSNHVRSVTGSPAAGDVVHVEVVAGAGETSRDLGTAFYNPHSLVALRHVSFTGEVPDRDLVAARLRTAAALRESLYPDSDAWRLCHGEADFLPGLVVDRYGDAYVVEAVSAGMDALLPVVARVLVEEHGAGAVVERDDSHLRQLEGLPPRRGLLAGEEPEARTVRMPPLHMRVDPTRGQKTGSFLDQRENRAAAARHARGRKVLDAYCNDGGFALSAALAGASSVVGVDSSAEAVEAARTNAELNGVSATCTFEQADASADMDARHRRRERYDLVIIDPPSFTRSRKHVPQARRALRDLNRRAMTLVEPGGILVTSTCSFHLREDTFLGLVGDAAVEAGRSLRWLELRSQPPDHPVLAAMPDSRYLKCAIGQVL